MVEGEAETLAREPEVVEMVRVHTGVGVGLERAACNTGEIMFVQNVILYNSPVIIIKLPKWYFYRIKFIIRHVTKSYGNLCF